MIRVGAAAVSRNAGTLCCEWALVGIGVSGSWPRSEREAQARQHQAVMDVGWAGL